MPIESQDNCWRDIGTSGGRTCPRLDEFIDCRNCPSYSDIGRSLLDRPPPEGYLDDWTALLAKAKEPEASGMTSVLAFRLAGEWMGLRTRVCKEVLPYRAVHRIPHRSNSVLLGIVNVRGELLLCVCLDAVLEVNRAEGTDPDSRTASVFRRMIVIGNPGERWVFPVDEVDRVYRVNEAEMEALPVTVAKDTSACSRAIVKAGGRRIAVLEEEQLLGAFRRGCLGG